MQYRLRAITPTGITGSDETYDDKDDAAEAMAELLDEYANEPGSKVEVKIESSD